MTTDILIELYIQRALAHAMQWWKNPGFYFLIVSATPPFLFRVMMAKLPVLGS